MEEISLKKDILKQRQRHLRFSSTKSEQVLWQELRDRKFIFKFRRQYNIDKYIVDFYCHDLKLIIELDGPIHEHQEKHDNNRQQYLESKGCLVLRFKNDEVLFEREKTMEIIKKVCNRLKDKILIQSSHDPSPRAPLPRGEGDN